MSRINDADFSDDRVSAIEVTPNWAGDLAVSDVDAALKAAGVGEDFMPKAPSRAVAMRRAFDDIAPRGAKIDMLPKGLGVCMSLKNVNALDLETLTLQNAGVTVRSASSYDSTLTAKVLVQNINGTEIESLNFTPDDHPMVPLLREVYKAKKETYKMSEDLSVWFSQTIVPAVGGVGKRSRGGSYYVPGNRRELLLNAARGLEAVSNYSTVNRTVNGVSFPIYLLARGGKLCLEPKTADDSAAMEIMVDGVIRAADSAIDDLSVALQVTDKVLSKRALKSKKLDCLRLEAEIAGWEAATSVSLDLLRNRITELQSAIGIAELAAEAKEAAND